LRINAKAIGKLIKLIKLPSITIAATLGGSCFSFPRQRERSTLYTSYMTRSVMECIPKQSLGTRNNLWGFNALADDALKEEGFITDDKLW